MKVLIKPIYKRILLISTEKIGLLLEQIPEDSITLNHQKKKNSISFFTNLKPSCLYSKVYVDWMKNKF